MRSETEEEHEAAEARPADLSEAVWAVWTEVDRLRQSVEALREVPRTVGTESGGLPKVVRAAIEELRFELAEERSQRDDRDVPVVPLLQAVDGGLAAVRTAVEASRSEAAKDQERLVEALKAAFDKLRTELGTGRGELETDRAARQAAADAADAARSEAVVAALHELRDRVAEEGAAAKAREAAVPAAFQPLLDELTTERRQRAELDDAVKRLASDLADERNKRASRDGAISAGTMALQARLGEFREEMHNAIGEIRDEVVRDLLERESRETAAAAALEAVGADLRAQREALVGLQTLFLETRREQEALAFQLPEATHEMQEHVAAVQARNVETLGQIESLLRTTMGGANAWFVRTRDELVERMDRVAAMADLGIAESMVAVLEVVRSDVEELRAELAVLGERPQLTAAHVRRIVRDQLAAPAPSPSPANGRTARKAASPRRPA